MLIFQWLRLTQICTCICNQPLTSPAWWDSALTILDHRCGEEQEDCGLPFSIAHPLLCPDEGRTPGWRWMMKLSVRSVNIFSSELHLQGLGCSADCSRSGNPKTPGLFLPRTGWFKKRHFGDNIITGGIQIWKSCWLKPIQTHHVWGSLATDALKLSVVKSFSQPILPAWTLASVSRQLELGDIQ